MAFGDPAEHRVAALLTPQFVLGLSAAGWTVGPGWAGTGRDRHRGRAPAIGHTENALKGPCEVWQTLPVATVTPLS